MIIECTDKRAVSIRWGNEIDKLMEKIYKEGSATLNL